MGMEFRPLVDPLFNELICSTEIVFPESGGGILTSGSCDVSRWYMALFVLEPGTMAASPDSNLA